MDIKTPFEKDPLKRVFFFVDLIMKASRLVSGGKKNKKVSDKRYKNSSRVFRMENYKFNTDLLKY